MTTAGVQGVLVVMQGVPLYHVTTACYLRRRASKARLAGLSLMAATDMPYWRWSSARRTT
eukprot:scaffold63391_cov50-Prasinocladus_malaysianus.AAC.1